MLLSQCEQLNAVAFPEFQGERHYMVKFFEKDGLPEFLSRFQPTVNQMLENIDTRDNPIFITIDEKEIKAGKSHRRGGVHIDGYWIDELRAHRGGGHRGSIRINDTDSWKGSYNHPESIVLASSLAASKGWVGEFDGLIGDRGDCAGVDLSTMESFILQPNIVYRGNVSFVHESLPVEQDVQRTLIRMNIKNC